MLSVVFLGLSFLGGSLFWDWLLRKAGDSDNNFSFRFGKIIFSFGLGLVISSYVVLALSLLLESLFGGLVVFCILGSVYGALRSSLPHSSVVFFETGVFGKFRDGVVARFERLLLRNPTRSLLRRFFSIETILFLIGAVVAILSLQSMLFDADGYPFGILKGWGDGAYHLDMVQRLAGVDPFTLDQPVAGGRVLSYPFLVNFISAILLKAGASLSIAWHLPTIIFNLGLVFGLFKLGKKFFHRKILALAFVFLVLFGAGLGYFRFFEEIKEDSRTTGWGAALVSNFVDPKFEYSHLDSRTGGKLSEKNTNDNIVWIVPAISFFSHQRSFILGGFLGVLFLIGFLPRFRSGSELSRDKDDYNYRSLFILALMPLAHTHSFLALFILAGILIVLSGRFIEALKNKSVWFSGLAALPQVAYLFFALKFSGGQGFTPWFGWMACKHSSSWFFCDQGVLGTDSSVFLFWLKNFGAVFAVWVVAIFVFQFMKRKTNLFKLSLASIALFMIPNLILFQPWEFDNNKFLFWWWVIAILLVLVLFDSKMVKSQSASWPTKFKILNILLVMFIFSSSLSGIIDVAYRLRPGLKIEKNTRNFGYYGEKEKKIAGWIENNTKPNDIFLTSSSPTQFVPMLSGRSIYLGFTGWVWTQGGGAIVSDRQAKIREFVNFGDTKNLCQDGVRYWFFDEEFSREYPAPEDRFSDLPILFEFDSIKILSLDCDRD